MIDVIDEDVVIDDDVVVDIVVYDDGDDSSLLLRTYLIVNIMTTIFYCLIVYSIRIYHTTSYNTQLMSSVLLFLHVVGIPLTVYLAVPRSNLRIQTLKQRTIV